MKVFKTLRDNGDHAQYSVFFCQLNMRELAEIKFRLSTMINNREDQIMILDLGSVTPGELINLDCIGLPYNPPTRSRIV